MAQPPRYQRTKDFGADYPDQTDNQAINNELDAVAQTTDGIRKNLALVQADDGGLKSGIVTKDALAQSLKTDLYAEFSGNVSAAVVDAQQAAGDANTAAVAAAASQAAALASKNAAATSETNAGNSATSASASQTSAGNSATSALASKSAAATSESHAAGSEASASASASSALDSKNTAATSASSASDSKTAAAASEIAAAASETAAANAANAASTSETNAAASEVLAGKWASNPEDVVVDSGLYSAYHYMKKAKAIAGAEASTVVVAPVGNIVATDVQDALADLDSRARRVLLASGTANNSTSVILSWTDTNFDHYEAEWVHARISSATEVLFMNASSDGGLTYAAGPFYLACLLQSHATAGPSGGGNSADPGWRIGGGFNVAIASGGQGSTGRLRTDTVLVNVGLSEQIFDSGEIWRASSAHYGTSPGIVNAVKFSPPTGLIVSGTFRLYGIR